MKSLSIKKVLLPLAIAAVLPISALADTTFYGKANLSYEAYDRNAIDDENDFNENVLNSNASRIGVKGFEDLPDAGIQAIWQIEYETAPDDGDVKGSTFTQRNIYGGFQGGFGRIIAGYFDTALKRSQKKVDLFNDLSADIKNTITSSEKRLSNSVQYDTGKLLGDFKVAIDYVSSEDKDVDSGISSAIAYDTKKVYLSAAYDKDILGKDSKVLRLVGQFKVGPVQLGALYEEQDTSNKKTEGYLASVKWGFADNLALKFQYGESDNVREGAETANIGLDYKLSKSTKIYALYTTEKNRKYKDGSGNSHSVDFDTAGVGFEIKF